VSHFFPRLPCGQISKSSIKQIVAMVLLSVPIAGQDSIREPEKRILVTTLCDLAERPQQYAGKVVSVRADFFGKKFGKNSFEEFWIEDFETSQHCSAYLSIIVVSPDRVRPHPGFDLTKNRALQDFTNSVSKGLRVIATYTGRFDVAYVWRNQKRIQVGAVAGFGAKGEYDGRIVLRQVSDVIARSVPRK
jgi:hypothetical protein